MYDVVIIGAGPAGMGAAIYAKRAGMNLLVLDQNPMPGGQVLTTYEVDNYLGFPGIDGYTLGMKIKEHGTALEIPMVTEQVVSLELQEKVKKVITTKQTYETKSVILGMGAKHKKLGVKGEEELLGAGVSYCATCDGAFFREKIVAVVGGGDVALEDALYLAKFCKKVYVLHRRDGFRGAKQLQDKVMNHERIAVIWNTTVEEIVGETQVTGLRLKDVQTEEEKELEVDGVFVAVGMEPNGGLLPISIQCDEQGYIITDEDCLTNLPGVAAVGDIRKKKLRQIITAVADGAIAINALGDFVQDSLDAFC